MQKKRFNELEGLRGVAAVVVALYHFLLAFYAIAFFGPAAGSVQNMRFEDNLYGNPIMVFLSGTFAVGIFFVLSGFVLSIAFFQTEKSDVVKKLATKRYLRLMIPALASVILCFILMIMGIAKIQEVAAISHASWLTTTWTFAPSFFEAVRSGMYDIFAQEGNGYNNVLWTMVYEFAGSFLVFGFLLLFGKLKYRWAVYAFLVFATFNTWFLAFVLGMILADLYANGYLKSKKRNMVFASFVLVAALFFGGYPMGTVDGTVYSLISIPGFSIDWRILYVTLGALLMIFAVLSIQQVGRVFEHKVFSTLGKYTFSLYLVHLAVLYTFGMAAFLLFRNTLGLGFNMSVLLTIICSIPVVGAVAYYFEKYVDSKSIQFSTYVANIVLGKEQAPNIARKVATYMHKAKRKTLRLVYRRNKSDPVLDDLATSSE